MEEMQKQEYQGLKDELRARIQLMYSYNIIVTVVLSLLAVVASVIIAKEEVLEKIVTGQHCVLVTLGICGLFGGIAWLIVPLSAKSGDNLQSIAVLAEYIKFFYEIPSFIKGGLEQGCGYELIIEQLNDKNNNVFFKKLSPRKGFNKDYLFASIIVGVFIACIGSGLIYISVTNGYQNFEFLLVCFIVTLLLSLTALFFTILNSGVS